MSTLRLALFRTASNRFADEIITANPGLNLADDEAWREAVVTFVLNHHCLTSTAPDRAAEWWLLQGHHFEALFLLAAHNLLSEETAHEIQVSTTSMF